MIRPPFIPMTKKATCQVCRKRQGHLFIVERINGYVALCPDDEGLTDEEVRRTLYPLEFR